MKRILSIVLLLPLVAPARAQSSSDTVAQKREVFVEDRYRDPDRRAGGENQSKFVLRINDFSKKRAGERHNKLFWNDGHWAGIGIHYSGLITNLGKLKLPDHLQCLSQSAKSIGVTLNPVDLTLLKSRRFGLITGLGFEFNNFRFENNIALKYEHGVTVPDFQYEEQRIRLQKSKLFTCYLNVPLLVDFQMGRHNLFYVNAGVVGGWRMGSHTKIKANDPNLNGKFKEHGSMGLRNFHYGYTINIGYDHFALSATYYRPTIFKEKHGPQVQQINIGLTLML